MLRDDLLLGGTKSRFIEKLLNKEKDGYVYASPVYGGFQIALAGVCKKINKQADYEFTYKEIIKYNLPYPYNSNSSSGLFMNNPTNFNFITIYDIKNNQYLMQKRLGEYKLGYPEIMSFEEFQKYNFNKSYIDSY